MLYLLDTCILSYLEDPTSEFNSATLAALEALGEDDEVCLSILSVYELEYGLQQAAATLASEIDAAKREALESYRVLPLSRQGARIFADLKSSYRQFRKPQMAVKELAKHLARHTVDLIIASVAIEYGATVVSNDRIFPSLQSVRPALSIADWTAG